MNVNEKCKLFGEQFALMPYSQQVVALEELRCKVAKLSTNWNGEDPYVKLLARCERIHLLSSPVEVYEYGESFDDPVDDLTHDSQDVVTDADDWDDVDLQITAAVAYDEEQLMSDLDQDFSFEPAPKIRRFCAYMLDCVLMFPFFVCMGAVLFMLFAAELNMFGQSDIWVNEHMIRYENGFSNMWIFLLIGSACCSMAVFVMTFVFWAKGTSFGKNLLKLYVLCSDTNVCAGFGIMFLRDFLCKAIPVVVGFGFGLIVNLLLHVQFGIIIPFVVLIIWYGLILFDSDGQAVHDKITGTIVVRRC